MNLQLGLLARWRSGLLGRPFALLAMSLAGCVNTLGQLGVIQYSFNVGQRRVSNLINASKVSSVLYHMNGEVPTYVLRFLACSA